MFTVIYLSGSLYMRHSPKCRNRHIARTHPNGLNWKALAGLALSILEHRGWSQSIAASCCHMVVMFLIFAVFFTCPSLLLRFSLRATTCSHGKIWLSWRTAEEGESRESRVSWISHGASWQLQVPVISNDFQTIFKQMEHDGTWWNQYSKYSKYSNLTMTHTAAQSISLSLRVWVSCDPWSSLTGGRRQRELQQLRGGRQEAHSAQFNWCGPMWPMNRNESQWMQWINHNKPKSISGVCGRGM